MSLAQDIEEAWNCWDDDEPDESIFKKYLLGILYWKTKDGKQVLIQDMELSHINNILRIPLYHNKENWDIIFKYEKIKRDRLIQST